MATVHETTGTWPASRRTVVGITTGLIVFALAASAVGFIAARGGETAGRVETGSLAESGVPLETASMQPAQIEALRWELISDQMASDFAATQAQAQVVRTEQIIAQIGGSVGPRAWDHEPGVGESAGFEPLGDDAQPRGIPCPVGGVPASVRRRRRRRRRSCGPSRSSPRWRLSGVLEHGITSPELVRVQGSSPSATTLGPEAYRVRSEANSVDGSLLGPPRIVRAANAEVPMKASTVHEITSPERHHEPVVRPTPSSGPGTIR